MDTKSIRATLLSGLETVQRKLDAVAEDHATRTLALVDAFIGDRADVMTGAQLTAKRQLLGRRLLRVQAWGLGVATRAIPVLPVRLVILGVGAYTVGRTAYAYEEEVIRLQPYEGYAHTDMGEAMPFEPIPSEFHGFRPSDASRKN